MASGYVKRQTQALHGRKLIMAASSLLWPYSSARFCSLNATEYGRILLLASCVGFGARWYLSTDTRGLSNSSTMKPADRNAFQ